MSEFEALAKRFHRQIPASVARDAGFSKKDQEKAAEKLREATGKESLGQWQKKQQQRKGSDCDVSAVAGDPDLIPVDDEWSEEARQKAAESRKSNSTEQSHLKREKKSAEAEAHRFGSNKETRSDLAEMLAYSARKKRRGY